MAKGRGSVSFDIPADTLQPFALPVETLCSPQVFSHEALRPDIGMSLGDRSVQPYEPRHSPTPSQIAEQSFQTSQAQTDLMLLRVQDSFREECGSLGQTIANAQNANTQMQMENLQHTQNEVARLCSFIVQLDRQVGRLSADVSSFVAAGLNSAADKWSNDSPQRSNSSRTEAKDKRESERKASEGATSFGPSGTVSFNQPIAYPPLAGGDMSGIEATPCEKNVEKEAKDCEKPVIKQVFSSEPSSSDALGHAVHAYQSSSSKSLWDLEPSEDSDPLEDEDIEDLEDSLQRGLSKYLGSHSEAKLHMKHRGTTFFRNSLERNLNRRSFWGALLHRCGYKRSELGRPETWAARKVDGKTVSVVCSLITGLNSLAVGLETNAAMKCALAEPPCAPWKGFRFLDMAFVVFFGGELLLRIAAHRFWFLASPSDWRWNILDIFLVVSGVFFVVNDYIEESTSNLTFVRLLRIFRIIRVARVIRVARFFKEMRKIMFAILACLASLAWSLVFLIMIMFMFSTFFMQGAVAYIKEQNYDDEVRRGIGKWYSSMYESMFSLLAAILGGADWVEILAPLKQAGEIYRLAFAFYIVFVVIGVLNVLTGVFLDSAKDVKDRDLTVQQEMTRMDEFIAEMLELFHEFDPHQTGKISHQHFYKYIGMERVQAYLTSHELDTTHANMLYHLLDPHNRGDINIHDFILGLLRLKGNAKEVDTRVLLHEVRKTRSELTHLYKCLGTVTATSV